MDPAAGTGNPHAMGPTKKLDLIDKKLIHYLSKDGRMPVKDLVGELGISNPTLNSRIRHLLQSGVLKIAGLIDTFKIQDLNMALVAVRVKDDTRLGETLDKIADLDEVHSVYAVTGQYDIFIEVLIAGGIESLYSFMSEKLPKLGNIASSESFVIMKSKKKWVLLPPKLMNWGE
jgi:Lrp/AsnC family transcriptional regulator for asnA, asnC and gidA